PPGLKPAPAVPRFGPDDGIALLSRNENPFGPSPAALQAIRDTAAEGCWYANRGLQLLTAIIAESCGLTPEQVVIGSGSTEVLSAIALAFARAATTVCPELFWDATVRYGERLGGQVVRIPLKADMQVDLEAIAAAARAPGVAVVHLCNPNNPTGLLIPAAPLRAFARALPAEVILVVDEAYNELTDNPEANSVLDLLREGRRVIITRTFSKIHGMAGLRVGYALMPAALAAEVRPLLMSFGGNTAGLAAAIGCFEDRAFLDASRQAIGAARAAIVEGARALGIEALPSQTNFVYLKVPDADQLQARLAARGIMIRGAYGKWKQWARVSTGRPEDVQRFVAALPAAVAA
ncbi:MAG: histidinol-phosphate transaminase, partial [Sphingomonadaceae bacterium]